MLDRTSVVWNEENGSPTSTTHINNVYVPLMGVHNYVNEVSINDENMN